MNENTGNLTFGASAAACAYGSFLASLPSMGKLTPSCKSAPAIDPLKRTKSNFTARVQGQIDIIQSGDYRDGRKWFKRRDDEGRSGPIFVASLRNGTRLLPLGDANRYLEVRSKEGLLQFYQAAIEACENGELDELLLQTMPKRKAGV